MGNCCGTKTDKSTDKRETYNNKIDSASQNEKKRVFRLKVLDQERIQQKPRLLYDSNIIVIKQLLLFEETNDQSSLAIKRQMFNNKTENKQTQEATDTKQSQQDTKQELETKKTKIRSSKL